MRLKTDVVVIPGSPLTRVSTSNSKQRSEPSIRNGWWMVDLSTLPQGGKWSPSKELVLQWINWAWKEITTELVAQSFKSYSILKALNGTKDKAIRGEETGNWGKNRNNDFVDNQFQTEGTRRDAESMFTNVLLIPYTLTSACLFSIPFSRNFLWCLQREFVQQLRASWVCNPFL